MCFADHDGPVERLTEALLARTAGYFKRRLAEIRDAIGAGDGQAAQVALLRLAARWTPDALARDLAVAMELAALEGREAVFQDAEGPAFAVNPFGVEFEEQIAFLQEKRGRPTKAWTETLYNDHDRAFVVAGVTNMEMLDEFQTAVIAAVDQGDMDSFAKDFDRLVEKYGWSYNGARDWRIRTIFQTNLRTSYMAGRLKQMLDPDVRRLRPYWQYMHADTRIPLRPRPEHVAWDGLVLMWNDPWWDVHFPPNDWTCSCGVRNLSPDDLMALGKTGPDRAPAAEMVQLEDKASGGTVSYPKGVGFGWAYQPGAQWARGLVPQQLEAEGAHRPAPPLHGSTPQIVAIDPPGPISEWTAQARPWTQPLLEAGTPAEDAAAAFMELFGAALEEEVLWEDVSGHRVLISQDLFRHRKTGKWKFKRGREQEVLRLAETIQHPDEIWLGVGAVRLDDPLRHYTTRRYFRAGLERDTSSSDLPQTGYSTTSMFQLGSRFWLPVTSFKVDPVDHDEAEYLSMLRVGKLEWKRRPG